VVSFTIRFSLQFGVSKVSVLSVGGVFGYPPVINIVVPEQAFEIISRLSKTIAESLGVNFILTVRELSLGNMTGDDMSPESIVN
jgi:hypothetical protein